MKRFDRSFISLLVFAGAFFLFTGCAEVHKQSLDASYYTKRGVECQLNGESEQALSDYSKADQRQLEFPSGKIVDVSHRMLAITHCNDAARRKRLYEDLLKVTRRVLNYAKSTVSMIESSACVPLFALAEEMKRLIPLVEQVIDQATRRVLDGESVPAEDKIVSLFEPHTDIIKKDRRDTFYGHKVCLSVGPSNLITDCLIVKGNPADSTLMECKSQPS